MAFESKSRGAKKAFLSQRHPGSDFHWPGCAPCSQSLRQGQNSGAPAQPRAPSGPGAGGPQAPDTGIGNEGTAGTHRRTRVWLLGDMNGYWAPIRNPRGGGACGTGSQGPGLRLHSHQLINSGDVHCVLFSGLHSVLRLGINVLVNITP